MRSIQLTLIVSVTCVLLLNVATAELPKYDSPVIYARTGITSFNLPDGSSTSSPTISIDDNRDVALDVNFVGNTGNPGLFYGTFSSGSPTGSIVFNAADIISGSPSQNGQQQAILTVGFGEDFFLFDSVMSTTTPINFPLGVTGTSGLTLDAASRIGGRVAFGSNGDAYGTFDVQSSGFPSFIVYATDSDLDASSPFSFLYTPDMSRVTPALAPRIAAKVSTVAGFDFEEIRIFDLGGDSTLVAVETEIEPESPFSEFITNSVSISDDGNKLAFQAVDTDGDSGIWLYDDFTETTTLIASEADPLVDTIDIFSPDVNNDGLVVFRGDDSSGQSSVFVGDGNELIRLGGEGDMIETDLGPRQLGRRDQSFSQSGAPRINNRGDIGFIFQYYNPVDAGSVADGSLVMLVPAEDCLPGDVNQDGAVDLADIPAFVNVLSSAMKSCEADVNGDGSVDLQDIAPFVQILAGN